MTRMMRQNKSDDASSVITKISRRWLTAKSSNRWRVCLLLFISSKVVLGQAPTGSPGSVPSTPTSMPTFPPGTSNITSTAAPTRDVDLTAIPTSEPTGVPTVSAKPTSMPSPSPSTTPTRTKLPTQPPTLPPTAQPTVSTAPSPSPSTRPTMSPSTSQSPTETAMPTFTLTLMPTAIPTQSPSFEPSGLPTASPTDRLINEANLMFIVLADFSPNLIPPLDEAWQNLTAKFVKTYWDELYPFQSPFFVAEVGVRIASNETVRVNEWPPSARRFLQAPSNATAAPSAPITNDESNTTMQPTQSPSRLFYISFRLRIFYRVVNENDLQRFNRTGDFRDALFLDPFTNSPLRYANDLGFFPGEDGVVNLVDFGFDLDTVSPTTMPTQVPTHAPTAVPTTAAPTDAPQTPPTPVLDNPSDRRIIVFVVVVVFLSIIIAAGYLYYLVRKEDRQPIVGALPDDFDDREYYVETRLQTGPENRVSSDLPTPSGPYVESIEPLNRRPAASDNEQGVVLHGGTLTTNEASSVRATGSKSSPPPMAVLGDVPHEHHNMYGALGDDDAPDGIDGVDQIMEANPSFDSGDGSTALPAYDMSGFQMNVQNLDDV